MESDLWFGLNRPDQTIILLTAGLDNAGVGSYCGILGQGLDRSLVGTDTRSVVTWRHPATRPEFKAVLGALNDQQT